MCEVWYIKRAYFRDAFGISDIRDCQNVAEEVYFGFVEPDNLFNQQQQQLNFFELEILK